MQQHSSEREYLAFLPSSSLLGCDSWSQKYPASCKVLKGHLNFKLNFLPVKNAVMMNSAGNGDKDDELGDIRYRDAKVDGAEERKIAHIDEPLLDEDGQPLLHIVFVQPQIHWNTGNIGRTCLGLGARLHLVKPLGFELDDKHVRRAGLDYWEHVDLHIYESWDDFAKILPSLGRRYYFTKFGKTSFIDVEFPMDEKITMIFGSEVDGLTKIWEQLAGEEEHMVSLPMCEPIRSYNLSNTAAMGLWDAYKQIKRKIKSTAL